MQKKEEKGSNKLNEVFKRKKTIHFKHFILTGIITAKRGPNQAEHKNCK